MNKKIFTLLVGALLSMGFSFTASAQTPTVHYKVPGVTSFADTLRADKVSRLSGNQAYYLLSITDIANPTPAVISALPELQLNVGKTKTSRELSYVMFVDGLGQLRMDTLTALDIAYGNDQRYGFKYKGSRKFEAVRRASWCVSTTTSGISGSNAIFDFDNMATGEQLEAPLQTTRPELWYDDPAGEGRRIYTGMNGSKTGINLVDDVELIVSGWHFSQTSTKDYDLQTNMPLYSFVEPDSVLVLVIDDTTLPYDIPKSTTDTDGTGGWKVTVKYVAANDLIRDEYGNVRTTGKYVSNVLLFTLKKLDKFVLNADDYNAINTTILFDKDAKNTDITNGGWNPFTKGTPNADPHGQGWLRAFEVNDSLYRYGYMQFQQADAEGKASQNGQWLYVDTAFWNYGNDEFLRFNWSGNRRDTTADNQKWSFSFPGKASDYYKGSVGKPDSALYFANYFLGDSTYGNVYWRRDSLIWAVVKYFERVYPTVGGYVDNSNGEIIWSSTFPASIPGTITVEDVLGPNGRTIWEEVRGYASTNLASITGTWQWTFLSATSTLGNILGTLTAGTDYLARPTSGSAGYATYIWSNEPKVQAAFYKDSVNYILAFHTDSIMENQSKFRVVYDPYEDKALVNVYQTRVAYKDYRDKDHPVEPAWWTNSFRLTASPNFTGSLWRPSDLWIAAGNSNKDYFYEYQINANRIYPHGAAPSITVDGGSFFHSFIEWYPESSPKNMDKVMISTADTSVFFVKEEPLSFTYRINSATNGHGDLYRDSLFYVDIQDLEQNGANTRIATINQSIPAKTTIRFRIGTSCRTEDDGLATIKDDLYLIRNASGEYLCVPLYSITDSVYWVTPQKGEDPTQMPSYQWVVENKRQGAGSPFKLTNREFRNVTFDYVYVYASGKEKMRIGGHYAGATFANDKFAIIRAGIPAALGKGAFSNAEHYSTDTYSFLPLAQNVKEDQLLGYNYLDKDGTYVDVYAFKFLHFLATGADARFMSWDGYNTPKEDSAIYLRGKDFHEKLYFMLQEMPYENIGDERLLIGYDKDNKPYRDQKDYSAIYDQFGKKDNLYMNRDSIVMEHFGYMPTVRPGGKTIDYLKPLARQAYRLLLKDYYKFAPTIGGDYLTAGEQDRYILADRVYATRPYKPNTGRVEGVFGIPYFYFRNTYFGIEGVNKEGNKAYENYFALVQRLDTISIVDGHQTKLQDVEEYITYKWNVDIAKKIVNQVRISKELGAFIATVGEEVPDLRIAVRADGQSVPATFTLERDEDPLYRRFHWNDALDRTNDDTPLVLEFHRFHNQNEKLFENSGGDRSTSGGGWAYNVNDKNELLKDSLGQVISFLGFKNVKTFPSVTENDDPHGNTNYAFYVDTAFVNRGTGWIKPQYMLAVDVEDVDPCRVCPPSGASKVDYRGYKIGRYLFNTSMYAKEVTPAVGEVVNYDLVQPVNLDKIHAPINGVTGNAYTRSYTKTKWERLAFAWAIHRGDSLYVLKNVKYEGKAFDTQAVIEQLITDGYGADATNVDFGKLLTANGKPCVGTKIGVQAIIALDNNEHKDWVFSFRYIERLADDFIIESETTNRDRVNGPIIRPGYGGWVKYDNEVPIITRSAMHTNELLGEGTIMNVNYPDGEIKPVSNDPVASSGVKILGGNGAITVQNASGKTVVISNILGQTIANTVLSSDNASIAVPAGIVIVTVQGESATKVLVK
ncbi:MAG: DUF6383 domain-containing protein [Tannerella sp.]|nr:DUF6383 domain-containing protein [Tannerella sp.]